MPNWTWLRFRSDKDSVLKIKERCSDEDGNFDFNVFVPMPKELEVDSGSSNDYDIYYYLSERLTLPLEQVRAMPDSKLVSNWLSEDWLATVRDRIDKRPIEASYERGEVLVSNYHKYGAPTWYDWRWKNWGVKWNASDSWWSADSFGFSTPWNTPLPILAKLCEEFPDVPLEIDAEYEEGFMEHYKNENGTLTFLGSEDIWDDDEWEAEDEFDIDEELDSSDFGSEEASGSEECTDCPEDKTGGKL